VGTPSSREPYNQFSVAGYRQIADLASANDSRFIVDVGQSGHLLSRHYDDFLPDWQAGQHRPMRIERAHVDDGALGRLRLTP
jgi:penicillin amidase